MRSSEPKRGVAEIETAGWQRAEAAVRRSLTIHPSPPPPHHHRPPPPQWDKVENKTGVVIYGAGAVVLLWLSSTIVGAINHVPLIPKVFELVGLGYTAWFVYRYLLFKESRQELSK